jgi:hypothetical protein
VAPVNNKRTYPHVAQITDPQTQQAVRLLFDLIHTVREDLRVTQAQQVTHVEQLATLADQQALLKKQALAGLATAGKEVTPIGTALAQTGSGDQGDGSGSGGGDSAAWDQGQGQAGLSQAGPNAHIGAEVPRNLVAVGMIIGGMMGEFPALFAVAVDEPTRRANIAEAIGRAIWHLQLAGFQAGKNRNPSGATGIDNFTVNVDGVWRGYDCVFGMYFTNFSQPWSFVMQPLLPSETTYLPDGGIPD